MNSMERSSEARQSSTHLTSLNSSVKLQRKASSIKEAMMMRHAQGQGPGSRRPSEQNSPETSPGQANFEPGGTKRRSSSTENTPRGVDRKNTRFNSLSQSAEMPWKGENITKRELDGMRTVFDQFDEDKSGTIDAEELYKVMRFLGHDLTTTQVMELLEQVDVDNSGTVEFNEFTQLMVLYKEAARFKLTEEGSASNNITSFSSAQEQSSNYPTDEVPVALWQMFQTVIAMYFWVAALYSNTLTETEVDDWIHHQIGAEIVFTITTFLDIVVCCATNDHTDTQSRVNRMYLSTWFLPDFLSLLPYHAFVGPGIAQRILYHFKLIRLIHAMLGYWQESHRIQAKRLYVTVHFFIVPLFKALVAFIAFVHLAAVIHLPVRDQGRGPCGNTTFVDLTSTLDPDMCPSDPEPLQVYCPGLYVESLYVVTYAVTGVGFGELSTSTNERMYCAFLCFCAQALSALVVGRIASLVVQSDISSIKYHEVAHALETAKIGKLPQPLVHDVVGYREHCVENSLSEAYKELIENLPQALQSNITLFVKLRMIQHTPLFSFAHRSTQVAIARELESLIFRPRETIYFAEQKVASLYLLAYGTINLIDSSGLVITTLRAGDCFGENSLVLGEEQSDFNAMPLVYCEVFTLTRLSFQSVLRRFPLFRSKIEALAQKRKAELAHAVNIAHSRDQLTALTQDENDLIDMISGHGGDADERLLLQKCLTEMQEVEELVNYIDENKMFIPIDGMGVSALGNMGQSVRQVMKNSNSNSLEETQLPPVVDANAKPGAWSFTAHNTMVQEMPPGEAGPSESVNAPPAGGSPAMNNSISGDEDDNANDGEDVVSSGFPSGANLLDSNYAGAGGASPGAAEVQEDGSDSHEGESVRRKRANSGEAPMKTDGQYEEGYDVML